MTNESIFELKVIIDAPHQRFIITPFYPKKTIKAIDFDYMVLAKKNGEPFDPKEIKSINLRIKRHKKRFDFSDYLVRHIQVQHNRDLTYQDYRGSDVRIGITVKSTQTDNDRLLHRLYKEVEQAHD